MAGFQSRRNISFMRVMTIVGTRPEIIKLCQTFKELDKYTNHIMVHTGQNFDYELNEVFFNDLEIRKPDYFLNAVGKTTAETIGNIIIKSDEIIQKEKPDAILLYGDTNSCLAVISAKKRQIPIFHMEAGNRCFDQRVPEEVNRKIVDHLSDINIVITEHARRYLIAEGLKPETIIKSGSCMKEIFDLYKDKINNSTILNTLNLTPQNYFIISAHREENVDIPENFIQLLESLNTLAEEFELPIIFSTHPRTKKKLEDLKNIQLNKLIQFSKPFGFFDYIKLQQNAKCTLSDSGTITEESSILKFPAVTIRNTHERPEGMDEGTLIMCGLEKNRILQAVKTTIFQYQDSSSLPKVVPDYNINNVSSKIVKIILSYTEYINQTIWRKK